MAAIMSERNGFIKIVSEAEYNQVLGVHIIGANAGELIAEAALAIGLEITSRDMGNIIHTHPTLSEALMEASLDVTGEAWHILAKDQ
jgi:dihydrolipoamide dehydrogenase